MNDIREQELLAAIGIEAKKRQEAEKALELMTADRDWWRSQWDKLRNEQSGKTAIQNLPKSNKG